MRSRIRSSGVMCSVGKLANTSCFPQLIQRKVRTYPRVSPVFIERFPTAGRGTPPLTPLYADARIRQANVVEAQWISDPRSNRLSVNPPFETAQLRSCQLVSTLRGRAVPPRPGCGVPPCTTWERIAPEG